MKRQMRKVILAFCFAHSGIIAGAQLPQNSDDVTQLRELAAGDIEEPSTGRWYGTSQWKALIRLAQLGDRNAAEKVVNVARRQAAGAGTGISKGFVEVLVILEHVASIRQPEAVEFLKEYLDSNERLPDLDGGVPGTLIAQRAAVLLAPILEDFPVKRAYETDYTIEDIQTCRKWMNQHKGQWKIMNLPPPR